MHFSIPDTQEFIDATGNSYVGYNIHINGLFHCTVRYKQLLNLHEQLVKEMDVKLPTYPPKKFFPLTANQQEERRLCLEKYIQTIGQNPAINNSELLNGFLLNAQQETSGRIMENDDITIYLINNQKITLTASTGENSSRVLEKACKFIDLPKQFNTFFCLLVVIEGDDGSFNILRKLHDFESPILTIGNINYHGIKIMVAKNYWELSHDDELMQDTVALNLLYMQAISEVEKGWISVPIQLQSHIKDLQEQDDKIEYLKLISTFKYYGYLQFAPCYCDYPEPGSRIIVSIGGNELNLRIFIDNEEHEESFKVTRMRCWRITTLQNGFDKKDDTNDYSLELSFEYLVARNELQWITISSEQAILMSVCLQSMIDELLLKHVNNRSKNDSELSSSKSWTYVTRDGHSRTITGAGVLDSNTRVQIEKQSNESIKSNTVIKKLSDRFINSSVANKSEKVGDKKLVRMGTSGGSTSNCDIMENNAFHMIGDEDL